MVGAMVLNVILCTAMLTLALEAWVRKDIIPWMKRNLGKVKAPVGTAIPNERKGKDTNHSIAK